MKEPPPSPDPAPRGGSSLLRSGGRRVAGLVGAVAAAALLLSALPKVEGALDGGKPWDGAVDLAGARAFLAGADPYSPAELAKSGLSIHGGFGHPPTTPFWFLPFARLDERRMSQSLGGLVVVLLLLHCLLLTVEVGLPAPWPLGVLLFAAVLDTTWMIDHLQMAQISEPIAFLYLLTWLFRRRGADAFAGFTLGLACTCKLFPGLLGVLFLVERRWRALVVAVVTWLAVAALMTTRYGLAAWGEFFAEQGPIADRWLAHIRNASLHGLVLRWFRPPCGHGGPALPAATVIATLLALGLLLLAWAWAKPRRLQARGVDEIAGADLRFAIAAVLSFFVNPFVWEHYNVLLLLPLGVAGATVAARLRGRPRSRQAVAILGLVPVAAAIAWGLRLDVGARMLLFADFPRRSAPAYHLAIHRFDLQGWIATVATLGLLLHLARTAGSRTAPAPTPSLGTGAAAG